MYGDIIIKDIQENVYIEPDTQDGSQVEFEQMTAGENTYLLTIPKNTLPCGEYIVYVTFNSGFHDDKTIDSPEEILKFSVKDETTHLGSYRNALTSQLIDWKRI